MPSRSLLRQRNDLLPSHIPVYVTTRAG
jgi:hypothetical protein